MALTLSKTINYIVRKLKAGDKKKIRKSSDLGFELPKRQFLFQLPVSLCSSHIPDKWYGILWWLRNWNRKQAWELQPYNGFCVCPFLFSNVYASDVPLLFVFNYYSTIFSIHSSVHRYLPVPAGYIPPVFSAFPDHTLLCRPCRRDERGAMEC